MNANSTPITVSTAAPCVHKHTHTLIVRVRMERAVRQEPLPDDDNVNEASSQLRPHNPSLDCPRGRSHTRAGHCDKQHHIATMGVVHRRLLQRVPGRQRAAAQRLTTRLDNVNANAGTRQGGKPPHSPVKNCSRNSEKSNGCAEHIGDRASAQGTKRDVSAEDKEVTGNLK